MPSHHPKSQPSQKTRNNDSMMEIGDIINVLQCPSRPKKSLVCTSTLRVKPKGGDTPQTPRGWVTFSQNSLPQMVSIIQGIGNYQDSRTRILDPLDTSWTTRLAPITCSLGLMIDMMAVMCMGDPASSLKGCIDIGAKNDTTQNRIMMENMPSNIPPYIG